MLHKQNVDMSLEATSSPTPSADTPSSPPPYLLMRASHTLPTTAHAVTPSSLHRSRPPSPLQLSESLSSSSSSSTLPQATPPPSSETAELREEQVIGALDNSLNAESEVASDSDNDSSSTASFDMVAATQDDLKKLKAYNIHSDTNIDMPAELASFITQRIKASRVVSSPSARRICVDQRIAVRKNERTGIILLAPNLLFQGERHGGESLIIQDAETQLASKYLPEPPDTWVLKGKGKLSAVTPDRILGYISQEDATDWGIPSPFNRDQEVVVDMSVQPLVNETLFPFLTSEWKAGGGSEGHAQAALQATRGGACVVNYNHTFLESAGMVPSNLETMHFSLTCDMRTVIINVNWRDYVDSEVVHYSKKISSHRLDDEKDMLEFRGHLRNILDWAVGERLDMFHRAIKMLAKKNGREPSGKRKRE